MARKNLSKKPASATERANAAEAASQPTTSRTNLTTSSTTAKVTTGPQTGPRWDVSVSDTDPKAGKFYNYYTGEYVASEADIKPRADVMGNESGGYNNLLITEEDYANAGKSDGQKYIAPDGTVFTNPDDYDAYIESMGQKSPVGGGGGTGGDGGDGGSGSGGYGADDLTKGKRESAWAALKAEFEKYGLGSLVDDVKTLIMDGTSIEEITMKLRASEAYQNRFLGNKMRLEKGFNVYDEATYLQLENAFDLAFSSYNLLSAAGDTPEARRKRYANWIGGTVSPDEIKGRIQLSVSAANEDEVTKAELRKFYPMITDTDIVSFFLNPNETLPKLETKIKAAQVGAAAVRQGLVSNVLTAEELVAMGYDEASATEGYGVIAERLPTAGKLGAIYGYGLEGYGQTEGEQEVFGKLASAKRKREQLSGREIAAFSGQSGTNKTSLSGQSIAGQL